MPGSDLLLRVLSAAFQYGVLLLLFRFIARLAKAMFEDAKALRQEIKPREILPDEAVLSVVEAGDEALLGKRFAFTQGLTIGRSADNDIRIPDSFVSHRHAVVRLVNNQYVIEDMGSMNHTYLNDAILQGKAYLKPGDLIRIGFVTLRFER
ncbi:FHA domain-containing protein [uncultured Selenomonas sp.]|uniref:FHA domain-containing protein n=1 Tax=uncultured Selenomonas sp. TaxID=159275 RepID=UPI0026291BCB|nr:FHA domain-containing protein [uncultured Selenomonas sp.]